MFYVLTESAHKPSSDPLVWNMNGGPGCSTIGGWWLSEGGPLVPVANGSLVVNPYSYNNFANVLYVDSPVGVGFSTTSNSSTAYSNEQTAVDNLTFLRLFLEQHSEFKSRDLHLVGESFAGYYIPQLAVKILDAIDAETLDVKLAGLQVGNACTDGAIDTNGTYVQLFNMAFNSHATFSAVQQHCNFSAPYTSQECEAAIAQSSAEVGGTVDLYDLFENDCPAQQSRNHQLAFARVPGPVGAAHRSRLASQLGMLERDPTSLLQRLERDQERMRESRTAVGSADPPQTDPCIDNIVSAYLNRNDTQRALGIIGEDEWHMWWFSCSPKVAMEWPAADLMADVRPLYTQIFAKNVPVLVYSGGVDDIVPYAGTRVWTEQMGGTPVHAWQPWTVTPIGKKSPVVGGYVTEYDNFSFVVVRGAGHMVPATQPAAALHMAEAFVANGTLVEKKRT